MSEEHFNGFLDFLLEIQEPVRVQTRFIREKIHEIQQLTSSQMTSEALSLSGSHWKSKTMESAKKRGESNDKPERDQSNPKGNNKEVNWSSFSQRETLGKIKRIGYEINESASAIEKCSSLLEKELRLKLEAVLIQKESPLESKFIPSKESFWEKPKGKLGLSDPRLPKSSKTLEGEKETGGGNAQKEWEGVLQKEENFRETMTNLLHSFLKWEEKLKRDPRLKSDERDEALLFKRDRSKSKTKKLSGEIPKEIKRKAEELSAFFLSLNKINEKWKGASESQSEAGSPLKQKDLEQFKGSKTPGQLIIPKNIMSMSGSSCQEEKGKMAPFLEESQQRALQIIKERDLEIKELKEKNSRYAFDLGNLIQERAQLKRRIIHLEQIDPEKPLLGPGSQTPNPTGVRERSVKGVKQENQSEHNRIFNSLHKKEAFDAYLRGIEDDNKGDAGHSHKFREGFIHKGIEKPFSSSSIPYGWRRLESSPGPSIKKASTKEVKLQTEEANEKLDAQSLMEELVALRKEKMENVLKRIEKERREKNNKEKAELLNEKVKEQQRKFKSFIQDLQNELAEKDWKLRQLMEKIEELEVEKRGEETSSMPDFSEKTNREEKEDLAGKLSQIKAKCILEMLSREEASHHDGEAILKDINSSRMDLDELLSVIRQKIDSLLLSQHQSALKLKSLEAKIKSQNEKIKILKTQAKSSKDQETKVSLLTSSLQSALNEKKELAEKLSRASSGKNHKESLQFSKEKNEMMESQKEETKSQSSLISSLGKENAKHLEAFKKVSVELERMKEEMKLIKAELHETKKTGAQNQKEMVGALKLGMNCIGRLKGLSITKENLLLNEIESREVKITEALEASKEKEKAMEAQREKETSKFERKISLMKGEMEKKDKEHLEQMKKKTEEVAQKEEEVERVRGEWERTAEQLKDEINGLVERENERKDESQRANERNLKESLERNKAIEDMEKEIAKLREKENQMKEKAKSMEGKVQKEREKNKELGEMVGNLKLSCEELNERIAILEKTIENKEEMAKKNQREFGSMEKKLKEELKRKEEELLEKETALVQIEKKLNEADGESKRREMAEGIKREKESGEQNQKELGRLRDLIEGQRKEISKKDEEIQKIKEENDEKVKGIRDSLGKLTKEHQEALEASEHLKKENETLLKQQKKKNEAISALEEEVQEHKRRIQELNGNLQTKSEEIEYSKESQKALQLAHSKSNDEVAQLRKKLKQLQHENSAENSPVKIPEENRKNKQGNIPAKNNEENKRDVHFKNKEENNQGQSASSLKQEEESLERIEELQKEVLRAQEELRTRGKEWSGVLENRDARLKEEKTQREMMEQELKGLKQKLIEKIAEAKNSKEKMVETMQDNQKLELIVKKLKESLQEDQKLDELEEEKRKNKLLMERVLYLLKAYETIVNSLCQEQVWDVFKTPNLSERILLDSQWPLLQREIDGFLKLVLDKQAELNRALNEKIEAVDQLNEYIARQLSVVSKPQSRLTFSDDESGSNRDNLEQKEPISHGRHLVARNRQLEQEVSALQSHCLTLKEENTRLMVKLEEMDESLDQGVLAENKQTQQVKQK